ncbi:MAG: hypothetical protein FWD46_03970 [Cystobacterineae bacterium]|nr:hypothetical protein [Cystobacterineae bacterium]
MYFLLIYGNHLADGTTDKSACRLLAKPPQSGVGLWQACIRRMRQRPRRR